MGISVPFFEYGGLMGHIMDHEMPFFEYGGLMGHELLLP
jgi:hypothetical protein